jgi:serine/threonine protein kinase
MSKLKLSQKRKISLEIARGMRFLHERKPHNIMHRDIKPTNILLTKSLRAKIADFGLARVDKFTEPNLNNSDSHNNLTTEVGTKRYMAPEIYQREKYNKKVDIYAFGLLLYELFEDIRYVPGQCLTFKKSSRSLQSFIKKMVNNNPDMRPDTASIYRELSNIFHAKNKFSSFVLSYF